MNTESLTFGILIILFIIYVFIKYENRTSEISKEELGRSTWTLLHKMCTKYPDNPSRNEKDEMIHFISTLYRLYPCEECSFHFEEYVKKNPPNVESKKELKNWFCKLHNFINKRLDKSIFNCDLIDYQWGN